MTPDAPDDPGEYRAERMECPCFTEAFGNAEALAWLEAEALAGARWLARFWLMVGLVIGACAAYLYQSPWAVMAMLPWAVCQAVERLFAWQFGKR